MESMVIQMSNIRNKHGHFFRTSSEVVETEQSTLVTLTTYFIKVKRKEGTLDHLPNCLGVGKL